MVKDLASCSTSMAIDSSRGSFESFSIRAADEIGRCREVQGYGRRGKARTGDGEGLEEMRCPNWDTFCSVSSDGGGKIASPDLVDLVIWVDVRSCKPGDPPQPITFQSPPHCVPDCNVWGSTGGSPCRVVESM